MTQKADTIKTLLSTTLLLLTAATTTLAQADPEGINVMVGGSFAKHKIMSNLERLALSQITVNYKLTTMERTVGKEKRTGKMAGASSRLILKLQMWRSIHLIFKKLPTTFITTSRRD